MYTGHEQTIERTDRQRDRQKRRQSALHLTRKSRLCLHNYAIQMETIKYSMFEVAFGSNFGSARCPKPCAKAPHIPHICWIRRFKFQKAKLFGTQYVPAVLSWIVWVIWQHQKSTNKKLANQTVCGDKTTGSLVHIYLKSLHHLLERSNSQCKSRLQLNGGCCEHLKWTLENGCWTAVNEVARKFCPYAGRICCRTDVVTGVEAGVEVEHSTARNTPPNNFPAN